MGTEPAPSPPASCQSPPDLHGLPGREEGLCQKSEGLKGERKEGVLPQGLGTPRCLGAPMGAHGSHGIGGPHEASGLPQGLTWRLGTPRCLGAPTGAQGSHGGWEAPRCLGAPTGGSVLWESGGGRPRSQEPGPAAPGWGLPALGSSSVCLGQFPAGCPLHLPMEPDAALGKIPSGVCCLSPPSRHPRWRRCVSINGKSLHKYWEKSKREKGEKNSPSGMPWGHLGDGHRQMGRQVTNSHHLVGGPSGSRQGWAWFGCGHHGAVALGRGQACLGHQQKPRSMGGAKLPWLYNT